MSDDDRLEVWLRTAGSGEAIIGALESTIEGIKPQAKNKFMLELDLKEQKEVKK